MSERRACRLIKSDRQMVRYRSTRPPETALRTRLRELANERRSVGHRRLFIMLRREGEASGDEPHLPAVPGGRAGCAQAKGAQTRRWHSCAHSC